MGIFSRLTDIINSNLNSILDRAEDPEKLIRLVIQEMEDTLVEVRSSTVRTIAERKEIERKLNQLNRDLEEWQRKAELALSRDRDDLAKGALVAKSKIAEQIDVLEHQLVHIEEALAKSSEDISRLQEKLTDAKKREKAIVLRHKSAASRLKVNTQIHDDRINDAFARFEQVERNLDELEGRAESLDIGRRKTLAEEFSDFEASTKVEQELADLKARLHNSKPMAAG
jgi:phage shock protein A